MKPKPFSRVVLLGLPAILILCLGSVIGSLNPVRFGHDVEAATGAGLSAGQSAAILGGQSLLQDAPAFQVFLPLLENH